MAGKGNRLPIIVGLAAAAVVVVVAALLLSRGAPEAGSAERAGGGAPASAVVARDKAVAWLKSQQEADGSYGEKMVKENRVGLTALALRALITSKGVTADDPAVAKAVAFILAHRQPDGGIYEPGNPLTNYNTSLAVMALAAVDREKYAAEISKAKDFLLGIQRTEKLGFSPKDKQYGGWGYDREGQRRADGSNTQFTLEALKAAGLDENDEAWKKALIFVSRCQNNAETSDQPGAAVVNDGGGIYRPDESKAGEVKGAGGLVGWRSYGALTYAMFKSYLYAGLKPDDPRVTGALKWIRSNWSVTENPGIKKQGLYYYYLTFARAMAAYGERTVTTADGVEHDWAAELSRQLVELQNADGSWGPNEADRWMEGSKVLVTGYALTALNIALRDE